MLILGGGPTGLTAAIYAAREGMDALVIDRSALGGQVGLTERIDKYPGFPDGVGGAELAALVEAQARRYGVALLSAVGVQQLCREGDEVLPTTTSVDRCRGRAALIAAWNSHRRLGVRRRGLSGSRQSGHSPGHIGGSCVRGAGSRSSDRAPRLAFGWPRACPSFPGSDQRSRTRGARLRAGPRLPKLAGPSTLPVWCPSARFGPRVWGARRRSGGERTRAVFPFTHSAGSDAAEPGNLPTPERILSWPFREATDADSNEWVCRNGEPAVVNLATNPRGGEGIDG